MAYDIVVEQVAAESIAAVRVMVPMGGVGKAWRPALDQVWAFLKANPALSPGHNLFLYHHAEQPCDPMTVEFGVQVTQIFEPAGNIRLAETPAGEVATTLHVGPYERMGEAHQAIHAWCAAHKRKIGNASWEIYGDWCSDPARLETTIRYLLA